MVAIQKPGDARVGRYGSAGVFFLRGGGGGGEEGYIRDCCPK